MRFEYDFNERTLLLPPLDGYLSTKLLKNHNAVLEIGVYKGGWLFNILNNVPNIIAIGIDPYPNLKEIRQSFIEERDRLGYKKSLHLYASFSDLLESQNNDITYDVIHCDGEHSQSQVYSDLKNSLPLLKNTGLIIIDDIFYHSYPGVTAAAFDFIREYKLSPFLFTQKKLYICNPIHLDYYYKKTISILNSINVSFEENKKPSSAISYFQSNSIFGYDLIITAETPTNKEYKKLLSILNLNLPLALKSKNIIKGYSPPIILEFCQFLRKKINSK